MIPLAVIMSLVYLMLGWVVWGQARTIGEQARTIRAQSELIAGRAGRAGADPDGTWFWGAVGGDGARPAHAGPGSCDDDTVPIQTGRGT